jgi:nitroreductase
VITAAARRTWDVMADFYGFDKPSAADDPKSRVLQAMYEHMQVGGDAPVCVLFCVQPQRGASDLQQGGSIFPAVQNFLLAARAQGLGAAITLWHDQCEPQLRELIGIPDDWRIATLVTAGWPKGGHHRVRRQPVEAVTAVDRWDRPWLRTR